MSVNQAFNFKTISESVSTAGILNEQQLGALGTEGYQVVINLLPQESVYAIENELAIVTAQGIAYEYIPVDFSAPVEDDYRVFSGAMSAHSGKKLMLHCAANYRASAFYAIYAFHNLGWSESQVYQFIGSIWDLSEYAAWEAFIANMLGAKRA